MQNNLNAVNFPISPQILFVALVSSGLEWRMQRAQLLALESFAVENAVTIVQELTDGKVAQALDRLKSKLSQHTLMGLPIVLDDTLAPSTIELRHGEKVIYTIQNLAIPCGIDV